MMWDAASSGTLGLIAGQGEFPLLFAKAAASLDRRLIVFGVEGYTDRRVVDFAQESHFVDLGALGELLRLLKASKIKKVILAGGLPKREITNPHFNPDETARSFIGRTGLKGDDHILKAFQVFLKLKCGVSVMDSRFLLKDLIASKGVMTRRSPSAAEWKDLRFACQIAKGIGRMDIGQTVVVKQGMVLAVEAIEGTDAAIQRGGGLGYGQAVVVKTAKPNQDLRFDLPCVGLETLESLKSVSSRALGLEAGKTLMLNKEKLLETADAYGMTVVGL